MLTRTVPPIPRGFSLIEMMIAVVIVGLLLMAGVPAYTTWIQNLQIRTGAEAILNGMQLARAEAVRRNTNVRFVLDRKSTRLNSSHIQKSRMPSSA